VKKMIENEQTGEEKPRGRGEIKEKGQKIEMKGSSFLLSFPLLKKGGVARAFEEGRHTWGALKESMSRKQRLHKGP